MPEKGFFGALFDLSFSSFVTTKIIKVLYVIAIVIAGIAALAYVIVAFAAEPRSGAPHAGHPRTARVPAVRDLHAGDPRAGHGDLPDHGDQHGAGAPAARRGRRPAADQPPPYSPPPYSPPPYSRRRRRRTRRRPRRRRRSTSRPPRRRPRSRRRAPVVATTLSPARGTARIAAMTAILRYTAFTDDPAGGNPAGVVLDALRAQRRADAGDRGRARLLGDGVRDRARGRRLRRALLQPRGRGPVLRARDDRHRRRARRARRPGPAQLPHAGRRGAGATRAAPTAPSRRR